MNNLPICIDSQEKFSKLFQNIDYILTDCDGVLWLNNSIIEGSDIFINKLKNLGKKIIYASNNSTKSRSTFLKKFHSMGFDANINEIMVTSYAAGIYLKQKNFNKKIYVFGSKGIEEEFKLLKFDFFGTGPDSLPRDLSDFSLINLDEDVEAVVVGFDYEISYPKLIKICSYASKVKPEFFIATNLDETMPTAYDNLVVPGTGTLVNSIQTAVGRKAIPLGKPHKFFYDCIKQVIPEIDPKRSLMIGDRLSTDIAFANNNNFAYSLLVETGINKFEDVEQAIISNKLELVPTHYTSSLGKLNKFL